MFIPHLTSTPKDAQVCLPTVIPAITCDASTIENIYKYIFSHYLKGASDFRVRYNLRLLYLFRLLKGRNG